ncbi:hypothetical protein J6590_086528 [Homalodisca vitripennis]|nr:hypothetical protein J6590_086528 [Homalodisca vitripennis]
MSLADNKFMAGGFDFSIHLLCHLSNASMITTTVQDDSLPEINDLSALQPRKTISAHLTLCIGPGEEPKAALLL